MSDGQLLFLIRHGIAAERGSDYPDDSKRPLTAAGKDRMREIAAALAALDIEFDEILTSPYVRTRQTAEIVASAWSPRPAVTDLEELAAERRSAAIFPALASREKAGVLGIVGHMPGIGVMAAELTGASRPFNFRKGGVGCIRLEKTPGRGAGQLLWFAPPRLLRMIAKK